MVCEVCERDLHDKVFPAGSTICNNCLEKMHHLREGGGYSEYKGYSINRAMLRLVQAIQEQAEADGELEEFWEYWVRRPPLSHVWAMLWKTRQEESSRIDVIGEIGKSHWSE